MYTRQEILSKIKTVVLEEMPEAQVYLFGSRVTGQIHEESDWDILVLTQVEYPRSVKNKIDEKLFSFGLVANSVFSFIITTREKWLSHPGYYSLQLGIGDQFLAL